MAESNYFKHNNSVEIRRRNLKQSSADEISAVPSVSAAFRTGDIFDIIKARHDICCDDFPPNFLPRDPLERRRKYSLPGSLDDIRDAINERERAMNYQLPRTHRDRHNSAQHDALDLPVLNFDGYDLDFDDDFDLEDFADESVEESPNIEPLYPVGELSTQDCNICLAGVVVRLRPCCKFPVCEHCMEEYFKTKVLDGIVKIECPSNDCDWYIHREEIMTRLPADLKDKFYKFLIDANRDPHIKTCPRCSEVNKVEKLLLSDKHSMKYGICVQCPKCELDWCFPCQAPWHAGIKCKAFLKGDRLLKNWAHEYHFGQQNAQKCPKCKIFIQRSAGCDHMTCFCCNTNFCYRCGEQFRELRFLGDHYSRLSVFGCKYRFYPEKPHTRRFIRGAILGGKLLAGTVLAGLALGGCGILLGTSVIILPIYGFYKYHKRRMLRAQRKKNKRQCQLNVERRLAIEAALARAREKDGCMRDLSCFHYSTIYGESQRRHSNDDKIFMQMSEPREVEVWVHSSNQSDSESSEQRNRNENQSIISDERKDKSVITTADLQKSGDGGTVLHVKTRYVDEESDDCKDSVKEISATKRGKSERKSAVKDNAKNESIQRRDVIIENGDCSTNKLSEEDAEVEIVDSGSLKVKLKKKIARNRSRSSEKNGKVSNGTISKGNKEAIDDGGKKRSSEDKGTTVIVTEQEITQVKVLKESNQCAVVQKEDKSNFIRRIDHNMDITYIDEDAEHITYIDEDSEPDVNIADVSVSNNPISCNTVCTSDSRNPKCMPDPLDCLSAESPCGYDSDSYTCSCCETSRQKVHKDSYLGIIPCCNIVTSL